MPATALCALRPQATTTEGIKNARIRGSRTQRSLPPQACFPASAARSTFTAAAKTSEPAHQPASLLRLLRRLRERPRPRLRLLRRIATLRRPRRMPRGRPPAFHTAKATAPRPHALKGESGDCSVAKRIATRSQSWARERRETGRRPLNTPRHPRLPPLARGSRRTRGSATAWGVPAARRRVGTSHCRKDSYAVRSKCAIPLRETPLWWTWQLF